MPDVKQEAHPLDVPLIADSVEAPIVQYGGDVTAIHFATEDGLWGRATFDRLDSIKVCRGEYSPFPRASASEGKFHWVTTVSNSQWLQERYQYEKKHYGRAYNFGGNVDEMLAESSHYVFEFHDQFVEVLAAGIWFESATNMLTSGDLSSDHPFRGLRDVTPSEKFTEAGITCQVRRNPLSTNELMSRAVLCSQPILEVAAELDGRVGTNWSLTLRVRNGIIKSCLRNYFGNLVASFENVPDLSAIRPAIDNWLKDVRERRRKMGKV
jgi:hypothetical protein